jgi:hypothetical protein
LTCPASIELAGACCGLYVITFTLVCRLLMLVLRHVLVPLASCALVASEPYLILRHEDFKPTINQVVG